jgi:hypothetical protein
MSYIDYDGDVKALERLEREEVQQRAAAAIKAIGDVRHVDTLDALVAALALHLANNISPTDTAALFAEGCGLMAAELILRRCAAH